MCSLSPAISKQKCCLKFGTTWGEPASRGDDSFPCELCYWHNHSLKWIPGAFLPSPAAVHFLRWVLEINNKKFLKSRNTQSRHHCQDELSITGTESGKVPGERGALGIQCSVGMECQLGEIKKFWRWMVHNNVNIQNAIEPYTLKWSKWCSSWGQLLGASFCTPEGGGFNSWSGHMRRWRLQSPGKDRKLVRMVNLLWCIFYHNKKMKNVTFTFSIGQHFTRQLLLSWKCFLSSSPSPFRCWLCCAHGSLWLLPWHHATIQRSGQRYRMAGYRLCEVKLKIRTAFPIDCPVIQDEGYVCGFSRNLRL